MPDADVWYFARLNLGMPHDDALQRLIREVEWEQRTIKVWGREHPQPRLVAWYGNPGCYYSYSGLRLEPFPWTELLWSLKECVETTVKSTFNSALLNFYRDHRDSMGFHSDDEPELGPEPIIASLSFGAQRVFVLKHRSKKMQPVRLRLGAGSLLLMKGGTQKHWVHGINKQASPCGPRVNITFRRIVHDS